MNSILRTLAFMGGWLEQMSGFSEGSRLATVGILASLLMPTEARKAESAAAPSGASSSISQRPRCRRTSDRAPWDCRLDGCGQFKSFATVRTTTKAGSR
jgi:hypothetical protein